LVFNVVINNYYPGNLIMPVTTVYKKMKTNGKIFISFGLLCVLLSACGGIPKICGPRDPNIKNFEAVGFKSGSTVSVKSGYPFSPEEKNILEKEFAKKNLKYMRGVKKHFEHCFDVYTEYIKENEYDLTPSQKFEIRKKHNAVPMRPDYNITIGQMKGFGTNSGSRIFYITIVKEGETAISLSDFDYFTNRCHFVRNAYHIEGPIACPVGSSRNPQLCQPFVFTELIKVIRNAPTY
jgi:hypothetical protein